MKEFSRLKELMETKEELAKELVPYLDEDAHIPSLKHPLVFQVPYTPHFNAVSNRALKQKQTMLAEAIVERNISRIVWLHERPYRLDALLEHYEHCLSGSAGGVNGGQRKAQELRRLADMVIQVWTDSENIWQNYDEWVDLLERCGNTALQRATSKEDQEVYKALPKTVKLYRGGRIDWEDMMDSRPPLSWSLDKTKAEWFARRFMEHRHEDGNLITAEIDKEDICFYTDTRNEQEVVVSSDGLRIGDITKVT